MKSIRWNDANWQKKIIGSVNLMMVITQHENEQICFDHKTHGCIKRTCTRRGWTTNKQKKVLWHFIHFFFHHIFTSKTIDRKLKATKTTAKCLVMKKFSQNKFQWKKKRQQRNTQFWWNGRLEDEKLCICDAAMLCLLTGWKEIKIIHHIINHNGEWVVSGGSFSTQFSCINDRATQPGSHINWNWLKSLLG